MEIRRRNRFGVNTKHGYRLCELVEGDITRLEEPVDVLVTSAFADDYWGIPGTVIAALRENLGVSVHNLLARAAFDFRGSLGVWISQPLDSLPFRRLVCVELLGGQIPVDEALKNVFVALSVLEAKEISVSSVAMPLLGAGDQALPPGMIARELLAAARQFLHRSQGARIIRFVTRHADRYQRVAAAMDEVLGRSPVTIEPSKLLGSGHADLLHALDAASSLFGTGNTSLQEEWRQLLNTTEARPSEVGILSRKLVELLLDRLQPRGHGTLAARINDLRAVTPIAPWTVSYMHVLRIVGNEGAHQQRTMTRQPPAVEQPDLTLVLHCVHRLLRYWIQFHGDAHWAGGAANDGRSGATQES